MPAAAIIGAIGAIGGGTIAAIGANSAAGTQADAADRAAQLQQQEQANALAFQQKQFDTAQRNEAPWLSAGQNALSQLRGDFNNGTFAPWAGQFQAPNAITEQNDPGFQMRLKAGQDALERSAASRGGALTAGTARGLENYAQDYASNEYGNVYNRALQQYQQQYNQYEQGQANTFNRLAAMSGIGQTSAAQLNAAGENAANNSANISMTGGQQIGQDIQNAAYQRASGYAGVSNALANSLSGLSSLAYLNALRSPTSSGAGPGFDPSTVGALYSDMLPLNVGIGG